MHADAIKIVQNIEAQCDTNKLLYRGVSYWPLCRLRVWAALMRTTVLARKDGDPVSVANTPPNWPAIETVNAEIFGPQELGLLRSHPKTEDDIVNEDALAPRALFFARPEEYGDKINGAAFAKIIDSTFERAREHHSATKIEMANPSTMGFKRHFPSLFVHPDLAAKNITFDPPGTLENFSALTPVLKECGFNEKLDPGEIQKSMGEIFFYARIFEELLNQLNPNALFLSVYYHNIGMALMLACRWTGVKSIDLQHGRLGPYHGAYTQLTAAPENGYHLMPDVIWCWGEQTKHDIEVDKNPRCTRHGGIVGGNAWLQKWRFGDTPGLEPPEVQDFAKKFEHKRKILVSLQPLDSPINSTLMGAMQQSPTDWVWLMRLHPLRRHTAPEVTKILRDAGIKNFEIEQSTTHPLFSLLKMADHHVTVFSSVVIEAAAFGVPTSLIGLEGRDIFKAQIESGVCKYTPTAAELRDHIDGIGRDTSQDIGYDFIDEPGDILCELMKFTSQAQSTSTN